VTALREAVCRVRSLCRRHRFPLLLDAEGQSPNRKAMSFSAAGVKGLLSVNVPTGMGGICLATPNGMYLSADCS
jgi:hypothetical protein